MKKIHVPIAAQPDDTTCGPTCLYSIYQYYGDIVPIEQVISEVHMLDDGGTLAVMLGTHALSRGYRATIYSYNLNVFDPTWFYLPREAIADKLREQLEHKSSQKMQIASRAYLNFLERGGELRFEDLTANLIKKYMQREVPLITGLSSTYLYKTSREFGPDNVDDDVRGVPQGHFVVLAGYDSQSNTVLIADPYQKNPVSPDQVYYINLEHLVCSILLGVLTYDANLLVIEKGVGNTNP